MVAARAKSRLHEKRGVLGSQVGRGNKCRIGLKLGEGPADQRLHPPGSALRVQNDLLVADSTGHPPFNDVVLGASRPRQLAESG